MPLSIEKDFGQMQSFIYRFVYGKSDYIHHTCALVFVIMFKLKVHMNYRKYHRFYVIVCKFKAKSSQINEDKLTTSVSMFEMQRVNFDS